MGRVDDKVVLISGGARGMGAAHAEMLEREGARVVIGDVLDDAGRKVAEKLGSSVHFVHLDVTDPDQWEAAVDACVATFGRIDALVNNAGIVKLGSLRKGSLTDWQRVLDVNLTGAFLGMRSVVEPMIASGGRIDRQHLLGRGTGRQRSSARLRRREVRPTRHHQVGGTRVGTTRDPRQLHPPRPCPHPDEPGRHRGLHDPHPDAPRRVPC